MCSESISSLHLFCNCAVSVSVWVCAAVRSWVILLNNSWICISKTCVEKRRAYISEYWSVILASFSYTWLDWCCWTLIKSFEKMCTHFESDCCSSDDADLSLTEKSRVNKIVQKQMKKQSWLTAIFILFDTILNHSLFWLHYSPCLIM